MKRNFSDFLTSYLDYARDGYCPDDFHLWTGLSLLAGALERKAWTNQSLVRHFPNIYVLLVSHPGVGKSTALERGVDLLEELRLQHNPDLKIIPNQITEPALIDMMKIRQQIQLSENMLAYHSSGYFYASEASASALQNLFGDFNASITAFYDCPKVFRKKIMSNKDLTEINNACFNILAGSTFDYLKKLVNEESVMGGLASRFIYVIHKDREVREAKWNQEQKVDMVTRNKLIEDLASINKIIGAFIPTKGFIELWEKNQPIFDQKLIDLDSPRMESLLARKSTNLMKLCMLLSVSEGNSMELNEAHWEQAYGMIENVTKDNAFVVSSALIASKDSQQGLNQLILQAIKKGGGLMQMKELKQKIMSNGNDVMRLDTTMKFLHENGSVETKSNERGLPYIKLLVDPDRQF